MADSYTPKLRLADQVTGENADTWGDETDANFLMVEEAITGFKTISVAGSGDYTLTTENAATDEARPMMLKFTGALTGDRGLVAPAVSKVYVIENATTGSYALTMKHSAAGTTIDVDAGAIAIVGTDGTDFASLISTGSNTFADSQTVKKTGAASRFIAQTTSYSYETGFQFLDAAGADWGGFYKTSDDLKVYADSNLVMHFKAGAKLLEADASGIKYDGTSLTSGTAGDAYTDQENVFTKSQTISTSSGATLVKFIWDGTAGTKSGIQFLNASAVVKGGIYRNHTADTLTIEGSTGAIVTMSGGTLVMTSADITFNSKSLRTGAFVDINGTPTYKTILTGPPSGGYRPLRVTN